MKQLILFVLFMLFSETIFSQNNYGNGNGMILDDFLIPRSGGFYAKIRKHEQQIRLYDGVIIPVYETHGKNSRELFKLRGGDIINVTQFVYYTDPINEYYSGWVKIETSNNKSGWVLVSSSNKYNISDAFYDNGNWAILETIITNNKKWTVRKIINSHIVVNPRVNLRDKPGISGSTVIYTYPDHNSSVVEVISITEEKDSINGKTDRWLRIMDDQRRIGWVFGGETNNGEAGGRRVKYRNLPEEELELIIRFYGLSSGH